VAAAPDLAKYLAVAEGSPLICLKRWVYDRHERLVEFIQIFYDPEMFEYRVSLSRESEGASPPQWVQKG
jgi:GntR family transcriptional regulator